MLQLGIAAGSNGSSVLVDLVCLRLKLAVLIRPIYGGVGSLHQPFTLCKSWQYGSLVLHVGLQKITQPVTGSWPVVWCTLPDAT